MQLDLVDMGKYGSKNKGYRWILTAIEILSRYAFAIPVRRKDGESMTKAIRLLLEKFKERFGKYPNFVQFDEGKEIYNGVRNLLKSHAVRQKGHRSGKVQQDAESHDVEIFLQQRDLRLDRHPGRTR